MHKVAALLPAFVLTAMLCACGAADDPPARPQGEDQALARAEAMLAERATEPEETPAERVP